MRFPRRQPGRAARPLPLLLSREVEPGDWNRPAEHASRVCPNAMLLAMGRIGSRAALTLDSPGTGC